jgi:hypothetical protein
MASAASFCLRTIRAVLSAWVAWPGIQIGSAASFGDSGAVTRLLPGLESTFVQHERHILQGAGHFSQEDAPQQIVEAINSWPVLSSRAYGPLAVFDQR